MNDPKLDRIARALARVEVRGTFLSLHREPAQGLHLEVEGVGRVELPVDGASAARSIAEAHPSCFGYRDQTRLDPTIRGSLEIPAARVPRGTETHEAIVGGASEAAPGREAKAPQRAQVIVRPRRR